MHTSRASKCRAKAVINQLNTSYFRSNLHTPHLRPISAHLQRLFSTSTSSRLHSSNDENSAPLIVGAGIIGLSSALALLMSGYRRVTLLSSKFSPHTTSDAAGASIVPYSGAPQWEQERIVKWSNETSHFLQSLQRSIGAKRSGVVLNHLYEFHSHEAVHDFTDGFKPFPFWHRMVRGMRHVPREEVEYLLGQKEAAQYATGWAYSTLNVDTGVYMGLLKQEILARGGQIIEAELNPEHITSFNQVRAVIAHANAMHNQFDQSSTRNDSSTRRNQISSAVSDLSSAASPTATPLPASLISHLSKYQVPFIVNCTGLSSRTLVPDYTIVPVKGIVLRVRQQQVSALLGVAFGSELKGSYTIPRLDSTTIGGRFGFGDESTHLPEGEIDRLLTEASKFVPDVKPLIGLSREELQKQVGLEIWIGHRPWRESGTRIELVQGTEKPGVDFAKAIHVDNPTVHHYSLWDESAVQKWKQYENQRVQRQTEASVKIDTTPSSSLVPIIHNYGHGGQGITVHIGCANEVVKLARSMQTNASSTNSASTAAIVSAHELLTIAH